MAEDQSEDPVSIIRKSTRIEAKFKRQFHRSEERRGPCMDTTKTTEQIVEIANRMKEKSQITIADLHILKNGLMDKKNLEIVLGTDGALRGLVRELTGSDFKKQCAAAGCFCNLALGDSRSSMAVAKAAGPYLVANLDILSAELPVTCAWTLGNMAGSGAKVCEMLIAQGALAKLTNLLNSRDETIQMSAIYALTHFAYQLKDDLRVEHLEALMNGIAKQELSTASSRLLFVLSCHSYFEEKNIPMPLLDGLIVTTVDSTKKHVTECDKMCCDCELVYLLRTLANLMTPEGCLVAMKYFTMNNFNDFVCDILGCNNKAVKESLLWLLGVLYKHCGNEIIK